MNIEGGAPRIVRDTLREKAAFAWSAESCLLFVGNFDSVPFEVYRVDVTTGKRTVWKKLAPQDRAGIEFLNELHPTADELDYAYSYKRTLSELYLVTDLK